MNLIEQLGGYEKVSEDFKKLHLNLKEQQKSNKVFMDAFDALKTELLEYRREHNIFEVGDRFVIDGLFGVFYANDGNIPYLDYNKIRHATDEEIKAGKRLGVNDGST